VDGIEHFTGLSSAGVKIDDDLLDEVARRGVVVDLTTGDDRGLHSLMPAPPPAVAALMTGLGVASFDEFYAKRIGLFTRLRAHGVAVVTGVDSGMMPPKRHGNAWRVVGEMVDAGYPAAEALAAATSMAADACGLADEAGRLVEGFTADILIVEGDLSCDVSALSRPQEVLIRGTQVALGPTLVKGV